MAGQIRCILFDVGYTLWERILPDSALVAKNINQALLYLQEYIDPALFQKLDHEQVKHELLPALMSELDREESKDPNYEPDFGQVTTKVLTRFGLPAIEARAGQRLFSTLQVSAAATRRLFPDALATLRELRARGYLLGIVTNRSWGGPPFLADLQQMGLLDLFPINAIAISADLGIRKPHAEIFRYALQALMVSPTEAAMVGDSLYADVGGAQALGITTIWKPTSRLYSSVRSSDHLSDSTTLTPATLFSAGLAYEQQRRHHQINIAPPDYTIEHLSELLSMFSIASEASAYDTQSA
ncbi:hypothetical protein KDH_54050 [Dictyobacter sp. S3.2.2.5]|uniref:Haloacid dehalogenase n=1 Tax=Dictyobacter halimunensis TaxID=3026934 RepID=A0ABQ6FWC9_9CHLR|nr:hypothetical protein KDH_54050 [Dictyobacter sp. S3.2.2.5]